MVNRHVLRSSEAVVRLNSVDVPYRADASACKGVQNGASRMREDIWTVVTLSDFLVELQIGGPLTPSENPRQVLQLASAKFGIRRRIFLRGQKQHRTSVSDLRAISDPDSSGQHLV